MHEQSNQFGSPYYGRSRGPEPYRGRYDPSMKGGTDRERPGYRQYPDGGYGSDQARYRERGTIVKLCFILLINGYSLKRISRLIDVNLID